MLINILILILVFVFGYWFFYAVSIWRRYGQDFLGKKYLGFKSYEKMRNYIIGANLIWVPVVMAMNVLAFMRWGWRDAIWVVAFTLGYAMACIKFFRRSRKSWEEERLPISRL